MRASFDVLVLGAGPAGLAAACRLAALGRRVAVISRRTPPAGVRWSETMAHTGVLAGAFPTLAPGPDCGIAPCVPGKNFWGGREEKIPAGFTADRAVLDRALAAQAGAAGVDLYRVEPGDTRLDRTNEKWIVCTRSLEMEGTVILDAAGRHSPWRRRAPLVSWRQVAVVGHWPAAPDAPAQWIESLPDAWLFGSRDGRMAFHLFLMVDPARLHLGVNEVWQREVAGSRLVRNWVGMGQPASWRVCEVTPAAATGPPRLGLMSIGDAALARDPLASQGVNAALSDGLAAAVAAHTFLLNGEDGGIVSKFMSERQERAIRRHNHLLQHAFATVPHATEFWTQRRSTDFVIASSSPNLELSPDERWRLSPDQAFCLKSVLGDDRIVLAETLSATVSGLVEPVAWLFGHPVRAFFPDPRICQTTHAWVRQWSQHPLLSAQKAHETLRWMMSHSILTPDSVQCGR